MSTHEKADYQILLDNASHYILSHATAANLDILPPVWDDGADAMTTKIHRLRITAGDSEEELSIPHSWLPLDSEGHNRLRTEVEAALARLKARKASDRA